MFSAYSHQVAIASQAGSPELLHFNRLAATSILGHSEGPDFRSCAPVFRGEPTCLLVVTSVRHSQTSGPREGQAVISQDLLESLLDPSAGISDCKSLLIQGWLSAGVSVNLLVCFFYLQPFVPKLHLELLLSRHRI